MPESTLRKAWRPGGCHCGAVRFEVRAGDDVELLDCDCSICRKTGFQHLITSRDDFRLLSGEDRLTRYTFNTGTAQHLFCSVCGIKSFYVPRSHPDGYSVNFRCLDEPAALTVTVQSFHGAEWERHADELAPLEVG